MTKLYDISPRIGPELAVWPGDTAPSREVLMRLEAGASVELSTLRTTVHVGAHVDAPSHYARGGMSIADRGLEPYLGPCQVMHVTVGRGERIEPRHLTGALRAERVLLATGTFPDPRHFNTDFAALSGELIDELARLKVRLVGLDTPSIDLFASKDLPAHHACLRHGMANLEGVVLDGIADGIYELIALPLPLVGFDASPVRAILREVS